MIGVFDSGYGGLTIFKYIEESLPDYDYIYLGDNARAPYGDHSQEIIYQYTKQAVDYLFAQGCDLIILACNTASAMALRKIQQKYLPKYYPGKKVLGVIRPLAEAVGQISNSSIIAVMGTNSTVESGTYINEFADISKSIKVVQQACPLLVPIIEESREDHPETELILKGYIEPLKKQNPDIVVLGCTHYGFLEGKIKKQFGKQTQVLNSGEVVAQKLSEYLEKHSILVKKSSDRKRVFLTSNSSEKFDKAAQKFLGRTIKSQTINF
ncbi:glutamate racemase [Candidatus Parcubacteria bacterium]|nr:MAG: glutamate racemase [Candidatus Parcubacteria bacterium]